MTKEETRKFAMDYAKSYLGTGIWYSWGGDDPMKGFDCSGFAIEVLKSVGLIERKADMTADGLFKHFSDKEVLLTDIDTGCLVFWASTPQNGRIIHVEIALNNQVSIGASGGGSRTRTKEDAIRDNAFIKPRPFHSRSNIHKAVDPFK